jgi:hypothetical protein
VWEIDNAMQREMGRVDRHVLKSQDDYQPVFFETVEEGIFRPCEGTQCSWLDNKSEFKRNVLRSRIEPWLTALFQSEHLSLLVGSGLMHSIHLLATGEAHRGMETVDFRCFEWQIGEAALLSAKRAKRETANIEDQIRVANELLLGLEHYCPEIATFRGSGKLKRKIRMLNEDILQVLSEFAKAILIGEERIASASGQQRETSFGYLISFLMSFASRSGTRDRLQIFTTNYDRLIEAGAEIAGLHLLDRFIGDLSPIFRSSRLNIDMHYNPPGIRGEPRYLEGVALFTKLHGSIDWIYTDRNIRRIGLPFGVSSIEPYLKAPGLAGATSGNLMIYPNSTKDRETAAYPYVELFRDFAAAICRPNNTLVTYGYSFSDEHINRVIEDMLTIPSTHLVIISYDDPMSRIMNTYKATARPAQTTLLIGKDFGSLESLVHYYLPKPAIDRTTIRMAKLLKARLGPEPIGKDDEEQIGGGEET